ncbi:MAG: SdrD B-like domain-containing protein [Chitinophagaceae bacterium]
MCAKEDGLINGAEAATPYATTVTDVFGNYIFNNLPATASGAAYLAGFVLPSGYSFVSPNSGSDDFKDSDANTFAGGYTGLYFLKQGQRNMSVDAGLVQTSPAGTASLGDKVWYDADADGIQDAGETGVSGVTVTLYNNAGTAIATTTTDANGSYLFANLAAGDYSVGFSNLPQGYSLTPTWSSNDANTTNSDANPATGRTGTITLSAGEQELDVDAGLVAGVPSGLASLGNKVWWDVVTANNTQDAGEPGVAGVTVNLYKDANGDGLINGAEASTPVATTVTNALGEYMFTGFIPPSDTLRDICGNDSAYVSYRPVMIKGPFDGIKKIDTIFVGQTLQLPSAGNGNITWNFDPTLSCTNCPNPVASPVATTTYTATSSLANDCQLSDRFTLVVLKDAVIHIPTAFTPNGDGLNDWFGPMGKVPNEFFMQIYDRNGSMVFTSTSTYSKWDGLYKGQPQGSGIFVYWIQYRDKQGKLFQKKGTLALIR